MSTLKRHRVAILVGLLVAVGVWWWHRHQSSSAAQDTSPNTAVPYYVSSPVPGSGGFYDTGSDWTSSTSAPSSSGLGTTGGPTAGGGVPVDVSHGFFKSPGTPVAGGGVPVDVSHGFFKGPGTPIIRSPERHTR